MDLNRLKLSLNGCQFAFLAMYEWQQVAPVVVFYFFITEFLWCILKNRM
jgi:hypothetical protein